MCHIPPRAIIQSLPDQNHSPPDCQCKNGSQRAAAICGSSGLPAVGGGCVALWMWLALWRLYAPKDGPWLKLPTAGHWWPGCFGLETECRLAGPPPRVRYKEVWVEGGPNTPPAKDPKIGLFFLVTMLHFFPFLPKSAQNGTFGRFWVKKFGSHATSINKHTHHPKAI